MAEGFWWDIRLKVASSKLPTEPLIAIMSTALGRVDQTSGKVSRQFLKPSSVMRAQIKVERQTIARTKIIVRARVRVNTIKHIIFKLSVAT